MTVVGLTYLITFRGGPLDGKTMEKQACAAIRVPVLVPGQRGFASVNYVASGQHADDGSQIWVVKEHWLLPSPE